MLIISLVTHSSEIGETVVDIVRLSGMFLADSLSRGSCESIERLWSICTRWVTLCDKPRLLSEWASRSPAACRRAMGELSAAVGVMSPAVPRLRGSWL